MIKQLIKTLTTFAILSEFNCYQNINLKNINNFPKTKKTSITALFSEKDSQNQISIKSSPNQLSSILETLTDAEKYNLLIQSKSSSIFEGNKNITEYNILTNLYKVTYYFRRKIIIFNTPIRYLYNKIYITLYIYMIQLLYKYICKMIQFIGNDRHENQAYCEIFTVRTECGLCIYRL